MVKISDAEFEVMKVIWRRKETTSLEIIEDLKDFNWNFNTVRTLIKRLQVKGAIEIAGRNGKTYTYRPIIDEDDYRFEATKDLLKKLYHNSINEFVLEYCETGELTVDDIKEVIRKIDERELEKKKQEENKKDNK